MTSYNRKLTESFFLAERLVKETREDIKMHTKTIEGIVGAGMNRKLLEVPMRIYREAERRGDTAKMEQAMGYATEFSGRAEDYKEIADEGMKEEAKEVKEAREKEEKEARAKEAQEVKEKADTVEISEEGQALFQKAFSSGHMEGVLKTTETVSGNENAGKGQVTEYES